MTRSAGALVPRTVICLQQPPGTVAGQLGGRERDLRVDVNAKESWRT
jgi:hypothetical protein